MGVQVFCVFHSKIQGCLIRQVKSESQRRDDDGVSVASSCQNFRLTLAGCGLLGPEEGALSGLSFTIRRVGIPSWMVGVSAYLAFSLEWQGMLGKTLKP